MGVYSTMSECNCDNAVRSSLPSRGETTRANCEPIAQWRERQMSEPRVNSHSIFEQNRRMKIERTTASQYDVEMQVNLTQRDIQREVFELRKKMLISNVC